MSYALSPASGDLLPYVYCKRVILSSNEEDPNKTNVTLKLELYKEQGTLSWMNNIILDSVDGTKVSMLDALCIQVIPVRKNLNDVNLLSPLNGLGPGSSPAGWKAAGASGYGKNIYVAKDYFDDGWLPRGYVPGTNPAFVDASSNGTIFNTPGHSLPNYTDRPVVLLNEDPSWKNFFKKGPLRQEIKHGKAYDIIPLEYNYIHDPEHNNLGFLFYSYISVPKFLTLAVSPEMFPEIGLEDVNINEYVIEGPPNAEIVFRNNKVPAKRLSFIEEGGELWEGPVHLHHGLSNAGPDNYYGDGSLGLNKGWMAGYSHQPGAYQPKLQLVETSNSKVDDYRSPLKPKQQETVVGQGLDMPIVGPGPNNENYIDFINQFVSPFQKERKRYISKFTISGDQPRLDGDGEFSKLYITRDRGGYARGLFFIDFKKMLRNNSYLYPGLFPGNDNETLNPDVSLWQNKVLRRSKILDLKLYRDRIDLHNTGKGYETFLNDTGYEESSELVGSISDLTVFKTSDSSFFVSDNNLEEVDLHTDASNNYGVRYFTFLDLSTRRNGGASFQYRLELEFRDGTYEVLKDLIGEITEVRKSLQEYLDLATGKGRSSYSGVKNTEFFKSYQPKHTPPPIYFDGTVFTNEFIIKAYSEFLLSHDPELVQGLESLAPTDSDNFHNAYALLKELSNEKEHYSKFPWYRAPELIVKMNKLILSNYYTMGNIILGGKLLSMIAPESGSPSGIRFVIKFLSSAITKLEKLTNSVKNIKTGTGSTLTKIKPVSLKQKLPAQATPSIREEYSFDHPKEIFHSPANPHAFIDYLSIGEAKIPSISGLKAISSGEYAARCRMEAARYCLDAMHNSAFHGDLHERTFDISVYAGDLGALGDSSHPDGWHRDYWSRTGYSFLSPSIIYVADSSPFANRTYSTFRKNANVKMPPSTIFAPTSYMNSDSTSLVLDMLTYSRRNPRTDQADLTRAPANNPSISAQDLGKQQTHKKFYSKFNITTHNRNKYGQFFNKEPGALSKVVKQKNGKPISKPLYQGYKTKHFSDYGTDVVPELARASRFCNVPLGTTGPSRGDIASNGLWQAYYNLPNVYKLVLVNESYQAAGFTSPINSAFKGTPSGHNMFLHLNMVASIQVYRGQLGESSSWDDKANWTRLVAEDLVVSEGMSGKRLFCKIMYYNKKIVGPEIETGMPILDEYFFIVLGAGNPYFAVPDEPGSDLTALYEESVGTAMNKVKSHTETVASANTLGPEALGLMPQSPTPLPQVQIGLIDPDFTPGPGSGTDSGYSGPGSGGTGGPSNY